MKPISQILIAPVICSRAIIMGGEAALSVSFADSLRPGLAAFAVPGPASLSGRKRRGCGNCAPPFSAPGSGGAQFPQGEANSSSVSLHSTAPTGEPSPKPSP